ncbi:MAG: alpha-galactosidase [Kiritimatiellaeota bacterium]|nr:alpha-galactosidase [Kiritimatiellota bacterium]
MFVFQAETGMLSCQDTFLTRGRILFSMGNAIMDSTRLKWRKTEADVFCAETAGCLFRVRTMEGRLVLEAENLGSEPVQVKEITIRFSPSELEFPLSAADYLEYIHGFNFGLKSGVKKVGLANRRMEYNPESSMVYVLRNIASGAALLFSTLPPHQGDYVYFKALHDQPHGEGLFGVEIRSDQRRLLRPGDRAVVSTLQCLAGENPMDLLDRLGQEWAHMLKRTCKPRKIGWNSWDYFAGAVTAEDIHANHRLARKRWDDKKLQVVIDEGWEPRWGVWQANWKFPEGLEGFCKRVRAEGGAPGIWTAPLLVNEYTDIYRKHPDWFGRDEHGLIVSTLYSYGPMAYLDVTRPEAAEWLYENFLRLKRAGFEYFKVDFTAEILKCTSFHDKTVPRGQIIRQAFETIRRAIGEDAYLLACGAPFESVTGVADASRVCGDIHNFWSHVLQNMPEIAARCWMDGRLWNNAPDFLIVRTPELSTHRQLNREFRPKPFAVGWLCGREFNREEAKTYALLVYLAGGDLFLGDDLTTLNEEGLRILDRIVKARPLSRAAVPVDLFAGHDRYPGIWVAEETDRWFVGVFNWEEDAAAREVDLSALGIQSFWSIHSFWDERQLAAENGKLSLHLAPRSGVGLEIRKA